MNLSAFEMVDFVVIDENATPLENIKFLQPDYFAKGYEYSSAGVHPKTREEIEVLESYGGEVIFTPGDVVFSSSRFIEQAPPNLAAEKLQALMEAEKITFPALHAAVRRLRETQALIATVALDCGYSDQSAFTRQFRKTVGLSPSQYRAASGKTGSDRGSAPQNLPVPK